MRGERLGFLDMAHNALGDAARPATDEPHPHAPLVEIIAAPQQQGLVEAHEESHFVDRSSPVLGGERVDRHPFEPEFERALDGIEECFLAGRVTVGALHAALLGPPAVAVHDDRDMARDARRINAGNHRLQPTWPVT